MAYTSPDASPTPVIVIVIIFALMLGALILHTMVVDPSHTSFALR